MAFPDFEAALRERLPRVTDSDLWSIPELTRLARRLFLRLDDLALLTKLERSTNRSSTIRSLMREVLRGDRDDLHAIFWYEFKEVRTEFASAYRASLLSFKKGLELEASSDSEGPTCGICMNGAPNTCLSHNNRRGCVVCGDCARRLRLHSPCPFCRQEILYKITLNGYE